jgi:phosphoglycerate dehydrogenase-like enzyme
MSPSTDKDVLLVTSGMDGALVTLLSDFPARRPSIELIFALDKSTLSSLSPEVLSRVKYIIGFNKFPSPEQVPNLEYVQTISAGTNHLHNHPLWTGPSPVQWINASGIHGPVIGEYVVMAILAHFHRYMSAVHSFQGVGHWPRNWPSQKPVRELYNRTVGIVGYGAIGRNIARLLTGFHVSVITLNSTRKNTAEERRQKEEYTVPGTGDISGDIPANWFCSADQAEKDEFFALADVIVVTAPYTPATKHLVDAKALQAMKSTALVVNIARGELIDQDALVQALKNREIGGVALDVITPEPYPDDGALLTEFEKTGEDLDRVILTPHVSGSTDQYAVRIVDILYENLARLDAGFPLLNLVDRKKGY